MRTVRIGLLTCAALLASVLATTAQVRIAGAISGT